MVAGSAKKSLIATQDNFTCALYGTGRLVICTQIQLETPIVPLKRGPLQISCIKHGRKSYTCKLLPAAAAIIIANHNNHIMLTVTSASSSTTIITHAHSHSYSQPLILTATSSYSQPQLQPPHKWEAFSSPVRLMRLRSGHSLRPVQRHPSPRHSDQALLSSLFPYSRQLQERLL